MKIELDIELKAKLPEGGAAVLSGQIAAMEKATRTIEDFKSLFDVDVATLTMKDSAREELTKATKAVHSAVNGIASQIMAQAMPRLNVSALSAVCELAGVTRTSLDVHAMLETCAGLTGLKDARVDIPAPAFITMDDYRRCFAEDVNERNSTVNHPAGDTAVSDPAVTEYKEESAGAAAPAPAPSFELTPQELKDVAASGAADVPLKSAGASSPVSADVPKSSPSEDTESSGFIQTSLALPGAEGAASAEPALSEGKSRWSRRGLLHLPDDLNELSAPIGGRIFKNWWKPLELNVKVSEFEMALGCLVKDLSPAPGRLVRPQMRRDLMTSEECAALCAMLRKGRGRNPAREIIDIVVDERLSGIGSTGVWELARVISDGSLNERDLCYLVYLATLRMRPFSGEDFNGDLKKSLTHTLLKEWNETQIAADRDTKALFLAHMSQTAELWELAPGWQMPDVFFGGAMPPAAREAEDKA